jgi:hypothetical protein
VPHGYVIEIEDRGLGMSDEELIQANERLANPPEIDFALSRVLGLYVVGRLGQRHGIKVQLRHSWYGGVTALTLLPHALLVWPKVPQAVPEPATVPGRAELPPPERAAATAGPAQAEQAPAGDHLPIFEAARSDWFVTEPAEPAPLPHRQRQHQVATADGAATGQATNHAGHPAAAPPPHPAPTDQPRPFRSPPGMGGEPRPYRPPPAAPEPARAADEDAPLYRAERARLRDDTPAPPPPPADEPRPYRPPPVAAEAPPSPPPAAAAPAPDQGERVTQAGLPRRVPRANLAPGMVASQQADAAQPPPPGQPAAGRSPDEVRSMLSSYRTGIERGRTVAGGSDRGDSPPDTP